jgi:hypothetical protein
MRYLTVHRTLIFLGDLVRYRRDLHSNTDEWMTAADYYRYILKTKIFFHIILIIICYHLLLYYIILYYIILYYIILYYIILYYIILYYIILYYIILYYIILLLLLLLSTSSSSCVSEWICCIYWCYDFFLFLSRAIQLLPSYGNPHNQLAVLSVYGDDDFQAVYHYFRSLSVAHPFLTARDNLTVLFEKNRQKLLESVNTQRYFFFSFLFFELCMFCNILIQFFVFTLEQKDQKRGVCNFHSWNKSSQSLFVYMEFSLVKRGNSLTLTKCCRVFVSLFNSPLNCPFVLQFRNVWEFEIVNVNRIWNVTEQPNNWKGSHRWSFDTTLCDQYLWSE